ncbi:Ribonucleases P [Phytophthora palmivora]|uniref:Ribonucleases P n=1 Tax=Phytophthora palmivora TaxID=4796 RepID=A0A2P4XJV1_9STRA|nr:Ribonucleases P [Phytophthora palmivora]
MVSGGKTPRRHVAQRRARLQGPGALLQGNPDTAYPSSRLLVWHSSFTHAASRHEGIINGHAFNQQLEVYLPCKAGKATAQSLQWETGFYYEIKASVDMFLSPTFIREYLTEGGAVFMVAKNAPVDAAQSAMLLPSGQLLLLVDAETYEQLGIVGEKYGKAVPATCRSAHMKRAQKYVITLDLTSFVEKEKEFRDRVRKCLRTKLEDLEMLLCAYNERGSARTILFGDDDQIPRSRVELNADMTTLDEIFLPKFDAFFKELGKVEEYVSTFTGIPDSFECEPDSEVTTVRWRGLLAAPFCSTIVEKVQRAVKSGTVPWGAVTVWGFPDVFVSWVQQTRTSKGSKGKNESHRREHGYLGNGSNNYTLLMLPNDEYFMLQALGPHDATV